MKIAVDFDGTIVEHRYPQIGKEIPFAIDTLKMLQQEGHWLILWSVREGKLLEDAVECVNQIIQNEHCRVCNCENLIEHMESELKNHSEGE